MNFLFLICILIASVKVSNLKILEMLQPKQLEQMLKTGQEQYQILQKNVKTSMYGDCWKAAMSHMEEECNSLSDDSQQDLALRFTNCFLEMSGYPEYSCIGDKKQNLRRICISTMSDRAFSVYTEFYTHTQNMCYYLYSKMWGEQTEETINSLNANSRFVNEQLKIASELQNILLQKQKEGLSVQTKLLKHGAHITQSLENFNTRIRTITDDLTAANKKHSTVLFELLERLNSLQSWAMGEFNVFTYALYYICSILVAFLLSATSRTADARFPLLIAISMTAIIERFITSYLLKNSNAAESVQDNIYFWCTSVRNISLAICVIIVLTFSIKYKDYKIVNYFLLLKLQDQNESIIRTLKKLQIGGQINVTAPNPTDQLFTAINEGTNHSKKQSSPSNVSQTMASNINQANLEKGTNEHRPRVHGMLTRTQMKSTTPIVRYDANKYHEGPLNGSPSFLDNFATSTPLKPQKPRTRKLNKDRFPFSDIENDGNALRLVQ